MKGLKHTIELKINSIEGIQVLDHKRDVSSNSLRKLNKISAIISMSRNKRTQTVGASMPLLPAVGVDSRCNDNSFRYKAIWDEKDATSQTMKIETNLHPIKSSGESRRGRSRSRTRAAAHNPDQKYESKSFHLTVGLKRGEEFIIFASSAMKIDGPIQNVQIRLPLKPTGPTIQDNMNENTWYQQPLFFKQDSARKFGIAHDAYIGATISVNNATTFYQLQLQNMSQKVIDQDATAGQKNAKQNYELTGPMPPQRMERVVSDPVFQEQNKMDPRQTGNPHMNGNQHMNTQMNMQMANEKQYDGHHVHQPSGPHNSNFGGPHFRTPSRNQLHEGSPRFLGRPSNEIHRHHSYGSHSHGETHRSDGSKMNFIHRPPSYGSYGGSHRSGGNGIPMKMMQRVGSRPPPPPGHNARHVMPSQEQRDDEVSGQRGRSRQTHRGGRRNPRDRSLEPSRRSRSRGPERRNREPEFKTASKPTTAEAFGNLFHALDAVAKDMRGDSSGSHSTSSSPSGSSGSGSGEDEDDYSSSTESSAPPIPKMLRAKDKSLSVRDDLTENSYALSLAEKRGRRMRV